MRFERTSRAMCWLRWLNAGFLILAACRALVPGLCATQLAAEDAAACRAAESCCCREAEADDGLALRVAQSPRGPCAWCNIMHGMLDPLVRVSFDAPSLGAFRVVAGAVHAPDKEIFRTYRGRAPPAECLAIQSNVVV